MYIFLLMISLLLFPDTEKCVITGQIKWKLNKIGVFPDFYIVLYLWVCLGGGWEAHAWMHCLQIIKSALTMLHIHLPQLLHNQLMIKII